jgi:hypothetical protein
MGYLRPAKGYIPGPIPGPLGGWSDWLFPWSASASATKEGGELVGGALKEEPSIWESFISGASSTPPPPQPASEPQTVPPGQPEVAPELPASGPGFFDRYKAFIIAGGLVAGYVWWKGRKNR